LSFVKILMVKRRRPRNPSKLRPLPRSLNPKSPNNIRKAQFDAPPGSSRPRKRTWGAHFGDFLRFGNAYTRSLVFWRALFDRRPEKKKRGGLYFPTGKKTFVGFWGPAPHFWTAPVKKVRKNLVKKSDPRHPSPARWRLVPPCKLPLLGGNSRRGPPGPPFKFPNPPTGLKNPHTADRGVGAIMAPP